MRFSEVIRRQAALNNKLYGLEKATCSVNMGSRVTHAEAQCKHARTLWRSVNDPFQDDSVRLGKAANAMQDTWSKCPTEIPAPARTIAQADSPKMPGAMYTHLREPPARSPFIKKLDKSMVGYAGFVPGLVSEGICETNHRNSTVIASSIR